jgi:hypothetical protein
MCNARGQWGVGRSEEEMEQDKSEGDLVRPLCHYPIVPCLFDQQVKDLVWEIAR